MNSAPVPSVGKLNYEHELVDELSGFLGKARRDCLPVHQVEEVVWRQVINRVMG